MDVGLSLTLHFHILTQALSPPADFLHRQGRWLTAAFASHPPNATLSKEKAPSPRVPSFKNYRKGSGWPGRGHNSTKEAAKALNTQIVDLTTSDHTSEARPEPRPQCPSWGSAS